MAITEALRILITADSAGAVRGITNVGRAADRELGRSQKQLDRWGNRLTTVGAGLVGLGAVAAYGLGQAAKSASNLGEAVNATNVVFGTSAGVIDKYAKDSATSMGLAESDFRQATTQIGAQLQNLGFDQAEAAEQSVVLSQRAADMASVFNTDVTQATQAVGAALRGERDPIERFGVTINEAAVKAKAMELGLAGATGELSLNAKAQASLALIMEQTDSIAGDFANTSDDMANKQRIVAAEFENLKASIGAGVLPVFEQMLGTVQGGIGVFQGLNDATGGAVGTIATIGAVSSLGLGGLSLLVGQVIKSRGHFLAARDSVASFTGSGGLGRLARAGLVIGVAVGAVEGLDAAFNALFPVREADIDELTLDLIRFSDAAAVSGELATVAGSDLDKLSDAFERVFDPSTATQAEHAFQTITSLGGRIADSQRDLTKAKELIDDIDEALAGLHAENPELAAEAFDRLRSALVSQGVAAEDVDAAFDGYQSALTGAKVTTEANTEATDEATSSLEAYQAALRSLTDPIFAAMNAVTGNRDAQIAYQDALIGVTEAQAELDTAIAEHGPNSDEAAEATRNLEAAERAVVDAHWATVESAAEADSALAGLTEAVENGDVSVDQFKATLQGWVDQGFLTQEQAEEAAEAVGGLASEASEADKERVDIPVAAPAAEMTREQIGRVRAIAEQTGRQRPNVRVSATDSASAIIGGVRERLRGIHGKSATVTVRAQLQNFGTVGRMLSRLVPDGERQHGGPVMAGQAYVVGEKRPELFVPDRDGMILPSVPARGFGAPWGGGGGTVVQVTGPVTVVANNPNELVEGLRRYVRSNGPVPIQVSG